jgi:hypothetical protein
VAGAAVLAAFALFIGFTTTYGLFRFLPDLFANYRSDFATRRPAYEWIAQNTARDANVFAYDDPLLYLYAGRKSCNLPIPPKLYYHDDQAGIDKLLFALPGFASEHQLGYVVLAQDDFYRDLHERGSHVLKQAVEANSLFEQVYKSRDVAVYRFKGRFNDFVLHPASLGSGL